MLTVSWHSVQDLLPGLLLRPSLPEAWTPPTVRPCHPSTACSQASWAALALWRATWQRGERLGHVAGTRGSSWLGSNPQPHTRAAALVLWGCLLRSGAWHEQCAGPRWCSSEHRPELEQLHVSDRGKPENCPLLLKPPEAPGNPRVGGCSWPQSVAVTPDFGAAHSSFMLQR